MIGVIEIVFAAWLTFVIVRQLVYEWQWRRTVRWLKDLEDYSKK